VLLVLLLVAYQAADRRRLSALVHWVDSHRTKGAVALIAIQITFTSEQRRRGGALPGGAGVGDDAPCGRSGRPDM
jgi:hypothetical protein